MGKHDKVFENMLSDFLGEDFIEYLKSSQPYDWLNLMIKFEKEKKPFDGYNTSVMIIELSYNTIMAYNKKHKNTIEEVINNSKNTAVSVGNGYLHITREKCINAP